MKSDVSTKIYKSVFGVVENHFMVNRTVKAVIVNFGDERGDIIVENDNYGTRRKYADFTEGKKKAGLNPLQIVFSGLESAIACRDRYIGSDNQIHVFGEGEDVLSGKRKDTQYGSGLPPMTVSCELPKETASRFKEYCRDMHIEYEPSECYNNIHFVLYNVTQEQVDKANKFIDERC